MLLDPARITKKQINSIEQHPYGIVTLSWQNPDERTAFTLVLMEYVFSSGFFAYKTKKYYKRRVKLWQVSMMD